MQVFEGLVVLLNRKKWRSMHTDYVICNNAQTILIAKKADLWKDQWWTHEQTLTRLCLQTLSSLSPAQILGQSNLFCKILGPAKVFWEKDESS